MIIELNFAEWLLLLPKSHPFDLPDNDYYYRIVHLNCTRTQISICLLQVSTTSTTTILIGLSKPGKYIFIKTPPSYILYKIK